MYHVKYTCYNCGHRFGQSFPKGQVAPQRVTCPYCGTYSARKDWAGYGLKEERRYRYLPIKIDCHWDTVIKYKGGNQ